MKPFSRRVGFVYSDTYLKHTPPTSHPEQPDRLCALLRHLRDTGVAEQLVMIDPRPAGEEQILAVHTRDHIEFVRSASLAGGGLLDEGDTYASAGSFEAAVLAAGGAIEAVNAVLTNDVESAFCAIRPPGHHAERARAMGFCLFNNVAIAARHAQRHHGVERVAILDWDVHHGNGTQHIFEDDPTVLYISLHQYPFYPGTGSREEQGTGKGKGFTLNIPLPAGTDEDRYRAAFVDEIVPALRDFSPGLVIISAGFDAHKDDPLANMKLTEESYAMMTRLVRGCAPLVSVLEGGYDWGALARSVEHHVCALGE